MLLKIHDTATGEFYDVADPRGEMSLLLPPQYAPFAATPAGRFDRAGDRTRAPRRCARRGGVVLFLNVNHRVHRAEVDLGLDRR